MAAVHCGFRPAYVRAGTINMFYYFLLTGGHGDGTGSFSSLFLLQVFRKAQLRGEFGYSSVVPAANGCCISLRYCYVRGGHIVLTVFAHARER